MRALWARIPAALRENPLAWVAAGILLLLYFGGLGSVPLLEPDEGRYTEIPREMLASGNYVLPHLDGVLYFEKPPLNYWLTAGAIKLFGLNPFATRFWNAAFGILGLWVVWALAKRMGGARAGWLAALILGVSPLYLAMAHIATLDMSVGFFAAAALAFFWAAQNEKRKDGWRGKAPWWGLFAFAALAVLSKGLIGLLLPAAVIGLYIMATWRWELLGRVPWISGVMIFLAIAAPWHVLAVLRSDQFIDIYVIREHFLRYLTPVSDRQEPWWFFIPVVAVGLLPWTGLWPVVARLVPRPLGALRREKSHLLFLAIWAGFVFFFFSASQSKLIPYMIPALWPLAILIALGLDSILERDGTGLGLGVKLGAASAALLWVVAGAAFVWIGLGRVPSLAEWEHPLHALILTGSLLSIAGGVAAAAWLLGEARAGVALFFISTALFFGGLWAAAPQAQAGRNVQGMARYLGAHMKAGDALFSYRYYPQALPVYLQKEIGVVAFQGELEFGISQLPRAERISRFPSAAEFKPRWDSGERIYLVTDQESLPVLEQEGLGHYTIITERSVVVLLTNRPLENG